MGRYTDKNLIRYEQAIQLHFDSTFEIAWLTLQNYGLVFHRWPWAHDFNQVKTITIGIPAGAFTSEEAVDFKQRFPKCKIRPVQLPKTLADPLGPFSISAKLDVRDIIAFQTHLIHQSKTYWQGESAWAANDKAKCRSGYSRGAVFALLQSAFTAIGIEQPIFSSVLSTGGLDGNGRDVRFDTHLKLFAKVGRGPGRGAYWIEGQIKKNALNGTGLIAYLPMPALMLEEQQTTPLQPDRPDLTNNQDMRFIDPLGLPSHLPVKNINGNSSEDNTYNFDALLTELDKDRELDEKGFINKNASRKVLLDRDNFPNGAAYLHKHVPRISCYGFRGDTRDPVELKKMNGFLPGITRTDTGVKDFHAEAKHLQSVMNDKSDIGGARYRQAIKDLDVLTLGVYTVDSAFKGYISSTKSTAIAKCLAGKYADKSNPFRSTYCYAVRCVDAFHLPTQCFEQRSWKRETDAPNAMTHFAEQEVAVPGAIFWSNVVAVRVIRADDTGRYMSGPVFLHEGLKKDFWIKKAAIDANKMADDGAFDELFELLSGKSQGKGFEILYTYPEAPFDCPPELVGIRDNTNSSVLSFK